TSVPLVNLVTEPTSSSSQSCRPDLSRLSQATFTVHPGYSPRPPGPAPWLHRHSSLLTWHTCGASQAARTASQVRQDYHPECEAALNSHAALELHASFQCLAVAFYLDRDDVGLKHFSRFFLLHSHEHSKRAESLMSLQNRRGAASPSITSGSRRPKSGRVVSKPCKML
uniref:Uncharacterized protein n=1 Tax=Ovis aries TaxID=9940 RepID=A0AC11D4S5_SHEEP